MKRLLAILAQLLMVSASAVVPASAIQSSHLPHSQPEASRRSPGRIIAQLPNFSAQLSNFAPAVNGFQFTNKQLTEAMTAATLHESWESYWQGSLPFMFGEGACLEGTSDSGCILTAPARRWIEAQAKTMRNGVCEGIATATLYLWLAQNFPDGDQRTHLFTNLDEFFDPSADTPAELSVTQQALQSYIADLFILQSVDEVFKPTEAIRENNSPSQIFELLLQAMQSNPDNPYTMGIYRRSNGKLVDGHTLTPFAIADKGNGIYWVYVYDSNVPEAAPYLEFDTQANRWRYQPEGEKEPYEGDETSKNLDLTPLSLRDLGETEYFHCPFCQQTDKQGIDLFLAGQGELLITNSDGQRLGFDSASDTYFEEISQAEVSLFRGGLNKDVPPTYSLPPDSAEAPYAVTVSGEQLNCSNQEQSCEKRVDLVAAGAGFTIGFEGIQLDRSEQITMYVLESADGVELAFTTTQDVEIADLFITLNDDEAGRSYSFEIERLTLPPQKTVVLAANWTQKRLYFWDNDGQDDVYRLAMSYISQSSADEETIALPDVQLGGEEIAAFDYGDWEWEAANSQIDLQIPLAFGTSAGVLSADPIALLSVNEESGLNFETDRPARGSQTQTGGQQFQHRPPQSSPRRP